MQGILAQIEKVRPARIVFDSLSEIRLLARDSLRYRRQILALKHFFNNRRCTVVLLDDEKCGAQHELQSIAHGVVKLERMPREYGVERRRIRVSKLRASRFREGFHDYTIETGGINVFPRLVAAEYRAEKDVEHVRSGIDALDALAGGGIQRGSSTLLMGPAGTGKSSLAMSYATAAARRGEGVAAFLFDETRDSALRRSRNLGMDLDPAIESGLVEINQIDPAELSPGEFIHRIRQSVTASSAQVVIIDSLNGLIHAMPGEGFLELCRCDEPFHVSGTSST